MDSKPHSERKETKQHERLGIIETFELLTGLKDECLPQSNVAIMAYRIDIDKDRNSIAIAGNRSHDGDIELQLMIGTR